MIDYDNSAKGRSRREVWGYMLRHLKERCVPVVDQRILIIEASGGLEIEELLWRGIRQDQIHVCNHSPAVVATLRRKYPGLAGTHGVSASRACARITESGDYVTMAYFDFTSCASRSLDDECRAIGQSGAFAREPYPALVGWNCLRGREAPVVSAKLEANATSVGAAALIAYRKMAINGFVPTPRDIGRATAIGSSLAGDSAWAMMRLSSYLSPNGQTMLWCVTGQLTKRMAVAAATSLGLEEREFLGSRNAALALRQS